MNVNEKFLRLISEEFKSTSGSRNERCRNNFRMKCSKGCQLSMTLKMRKKIFEFKKKPLRPTSCDFCDKWKKLLKKNKTIKSHKPCSQKQKTQKVNYISCPDK